MSIVERSDILDAYYFMAGSYARQNRTEEAIDWLRRAITRDFNNWDLMKADRNLENIRGTALLSGFDKESLTFELLRRSVSSDMMSKAVHKAALMNVRWHYLICLLLVITTLAAYWPVRGFEFVYYDDDLYVVENRHVQEGLNRKSIAWAFRSTDAVNWHLMP